MHIAYTDEQLTLRDELRAYYAAMMTGELADEMARGEMGGAKALEAVRQMGRDGWLGIGWPKELWTPTVMICSHRKRALRASSQSPKGMFRLGIGFGWDEPSRLSIVVRRSSRGRDRCSST